MVMRGYRGFVHILICILQIIYPGFECFVFNLYSDVLVNTLAANTVNVLGMIIEDFYLEMLKKKKGKLI